MFFSITTMLLVPKVLLNRLPSLQKILGLLRKDSIWNSIRGTVEENGVYF